MVFQRISAIPPTIQVTWTQLCFAPCMSMTRKYSGALAYFEGEGIKAQDLDDFDVRLEVANSSVIRVSLVEEGRIERAIGRFEALELNFSHLPTHKDRATTPKIRN